MKRYFAYRFKVTSKLWNGEKCIYCTDIKTARRALKDYFMGYGNATFKYISRSGKRTGK